MDRAAVAVVDLVIIQDQVQDQLDQPNHQVEVEDHRMGDTILEVILAITSTNNQVATTLINDQVETTSTNDQVATTSTNDQVAITSTNSHRSHTPAHLLLILQWTNVQLPYSVFQMTNVMIKVFKSSVLDNHITQGVSSECNLRFVASPTAAMWECVVGILCIRIHGPAVWWCQEWKAKSWWNQTQHTPQDTENPPQVHHQNIPLNYSAYG